MEIMNYLRNRDCFFEKLELDDISLNKSLKVVLSFGIFFNSLGHKSILKQVPFRFEARDPNNCPDLFLKQEAEV